MQRDERKRAPEATPRGFCPSAWTPMASGDGLLARVRASARPLSAHDLRAVARLAREAGNGVVELTRRANLQLRGVREETLSALQRSLVTLGLVDPAPEREQRLAWLIADPFAGLAEGVVDVRPLCEELERALAAASRLRAAPKFAIAISGSRRSVAAVAADIELAFAGGGDVVELHLACDRGTLPFARCMPERAVALTMQLLELTLRTPGARVRDLVATRPIEELRRAFSELILASAAPLAALAPAARAPKLGFREEQRSFLELAVPFGAGTSEQWEAVAELAERAGDGTVRLTPQRSVLLPDVEQRADTLALAEARGLITAGSDARLRITACSGAPRCSSAHGDTRELARSLAPLLASESGRSVTLHVSGCAKGCAGSGASSIAIVRSDDGCHLAYDADVRRAAEGPSLPLRELRLRLAERFGDSKVSASMRRTYDYERDPAAIYRRSFAIIRAEAKLERFSPREERVVVRMIHTSGSVDLAEHVVFSPGFAEAAERAIRDGAPILCDANMIVSGVTKSRLAKSNELVCLLDHPETPALAKAHGTTRSAAAISLFRERLQGAVVAVGNAPTALFRLLELLDETDARPAAILGLPVGFVGAVESKEALLADGRVPAMIVRGRRGGSALAVAAINALARDEE